ncbi:MAG: IS1380 family transposase [Flavobacteriaceae bacterium]|nr:MAG: IS1380 family transposase [Flavobacteriaceae bacterium]
MTKWHSKPINFSPLKRRNIEADFSGGEITNDAGALVLREVDNKLNLTASMAKHIKDPRDPNRVDHQVQTMLKQRIFGLSLAYEDLNDHTPLRKDIGFQIATGETGTLASPSTLCRLEQWADRETMIGLHQEIFKLFISQFDKPPNSITLDFDATDNPVHGDQVAGYYHGYYRHECFLPLYVYCGRFPLVSYLRPSWMDQAKHAWAILALLVKALRKAWPEVEIIFRADGGFCREKIFSWCDRNNVKYIAGLAKNSVLERLSQVEIEQAEERYQLTDEKQRIFSSFTYKAGSWNEERPVVVKAEHTDWGSNPRYVVTNIEGDSQHLYENIYCARGEMENRIKEVQLDLFADRTSCHEWWPNQLRLLFSTFSQILIETIRSRFLNDTQLAKATANSIRLKLLKAAAIIVHNSRRIRFLFSSNYVYQKPFQELVESINTS